MHHKNTAETSNTQTSALKKFILSLVMTSMLGGVMAADSSSSRFKSGYSGASGVASSTFNHGFVAPFSEHATIESALEGLNQNPILFHQISYESYTKYVAEKREDITKLWENYKRGVECQKEIEKLTTQLETHKKILQEFGQGDRDVAIRKIDEGIVQFKINIENYKSETLSVLKAKTEENKRKIDLYQSNREILNQDTRGLEINLKIARDKFLDIVGNTQLDHFKGQMGINTENLLQAYAKHTVGPMEENLLTDDVISKFLKTFENCGLPVGKLDGKKLYQLLARSMEFPYYLKLAADVPGYSNTQSEWVDQATKLKQTLANRLKEDSLTLQSMLAISERFKLVCTPKDIIGNQGLELLKILGGGSALPVLSQDQLAKNLSILMDVLSLYKTDKEITPFKDKFEEGVMLVFNGYFGLCIESLSQAPATSWVNSNVAHPLVTFVTEVDGDQAASKMIVQTIQSIIRRHINVVVLGLLIDNMKQTREAEVMPTQAEDDFYF